MKRLVSVLFNTRAAGLYILFFAIAIGIATFIENDFGTSAAQKLIYRSWWFIVLLVFVSVTIVVNIFRFRMVQQKKWALLVFHAAIIVILAGAAITRHFGFEGIMHIRENETSNTFLSSETYLQFKAVKGEQVYEFDEPVLFASLGSNRWRGFYQVGNDLIRVRVLDFIPNPVEELVENKGGRPTIKIVIGGSAGREEYFVAMGEAHRIGQTVFNFSDEEIPGSVRIAYRNDSLLIRGEHALVQRVMATQQIDTLIALEYHSLKLRTLYSDGHANFAFGEFTPSGTVVLSSEKVKVESESTIALRIAIDINDEADTLVVYGAKGIHGRSEMTSLDDLDLYISYGARHESLPFSIKLNDYIMERYPGTNNAASYASEVQLIDNRKDLREDHRIYMNHILNYEGYRFFQSSFDNDEHGTYLSVNHDLWGSRISYLGYFLLTIGMVLSLLSKKSRFYQLSRSIEQLRTNLPVARLIVVLIIAAPLEVFAQKNATLDNLNGIIDSNHADRFSKIVVQDQNGRMKPMHTLSREVLRKLNKSEVLDDLSADQVVLGMFANNEDWIGVKMIRVGNHPMIHKLLGVNNNIISYEDFFDSGGKYLLGEEVRIAYSKPPVDRGTFEKELIKIDERVNLANMVYSGSIFRIIPVRNDPNNTWVATEWSEQHHHHDDGDAQHREMSPAERFFAAYRSSLNDALVTNDYRGAEALLDELESFQREQGVGVIPTTSKVNAEILLNKLNLFNLLAMVYAFTGIALLAALFYSVFRPIPAGTLINKILFGAVAIGFALHTIGLGLRWYVSERAPWSNGYESMIYIAWTTILAGILFARKSLGGLAATMVIAATLLLVAMLSYLDPEITPLVPVLRSYWLTIHVSMEAGSYGFLMLGALIGVINLILMAFVTSENRDKVYRQIKEMSYLSEMTLIGGVFMISIGTYLGGVWANESWGRYWGWDAKETWALITILIYAFILHMRLIPKLQGLFAYNFASVFGLGSVIMTYYGVNYYLSGLHSYAAGDPVPIPSWVFIAIVAIVAIALLAFRKKRLFKIST